LKKNRLNAGLQGNLYYFRDSNRNEIDVLIEKNQSIIPIEIKSSSKFERQQLDNIK
jgi:predicted AAA+ superfamily ATPase